jgi:hypothetical protein
MLAAALVAIGIQTGSPSPSQAVTRISANIDFYDALAPYGSFERVSRYGQCWVPIDVPVGWRPYTVGYWVDTDYGWMWISQDPWGAIPYHYGRWAYDGYYGWVWVPDEDAVWAPAWVAWRYGDDCVGWAPLPPGAGWRGGSGLTVSVSFLDSRISRNAWCFTPVRSFGSTRISASLFSPSRNVTLLTRTRNVTHYEVYNSMPAERGLLPQMIERDTGHRFQRYRVVDSRSPSTLRSVSIQGNTIEAFRPRVAGLKDRLAREPRGPARPSRAVMQRPQSEQRRFDQRMGQERTALEREHQREMIQAGGNRARADEVRRNQQAEMRAQQEREGQERRALDQRRRIADQIQRNQGQGQGQGQNQDQPRSRGRGRGQGQDQNQGQNQGQGQGQGQGQPPADQGKGRGRGGQDQGQGQGQPPADQGKGRGKGRQDQGKSQDQGKGQDQGNGNQDDQNKNRGRGNGVGGN